MAYTSPMSFSETSAPIHRKDRIHQSVSRWCYQKIPLDDLCVYSAHIGLKAIDLLQPEEWEIPRKYGLICSMGYAGGGEINSALNRVENHARIEEGFRKNIPLAKESGSSQRHHLFRQPRRHVRRRRCAQLRHRS